MDQPSAPPLVLEYTWTRDEILQQFWRSFVARFYAGYAIIIAAAAFALGSGWVIPGLVTALYLLALLLWMRSRVLRRALVQAKISTTLDDQGVTVATTTVTVTRPWSEYRGAKETAAFFELSLRITRLAPFRIPKRAISPAEQARLRALLKEHTSVALR